MIEHRLTAYLKKYRLITDGSFGTYYADKYQTSEMPELANCAKERAVCERVTQIHAEYIRAGASLIRTNTFASNTVLLGTNREGVRTNIVQAVRLAKLAAQGCRDKGKCFLAGDIGPIPLDTRYKAQDAEKEYYIIGRNFIAEGIDILNFETFPDLTQILPAIKQLKADAAREKRTLFIMVQFSVNQFGYSVSGMRAGRLLSMAAQCPQIDAAGLNCGVGPAHMEQIIRALDRSKTDATYMIALPNAGYPKRVRNQIRFGNQPEYFVDKAVGLCRQCGVDIVGGCCGTTPEYIRLLAETLDITQKPYVRRNVQSTLKPESVTNHAFYKDKSEGGKLIAVELAPPANANDEKVLDAAHFLKDLGVDVLTFPDSPSGRTRIDSVLMAEKVHRETGMCVMPHICCRDKNAIAMRSTFLGAHINDIHNFLIITGDPVPTLIRQTTKAVFNFDSVGLMNIARDMNEENFSAAPLVYGGAINQGRKNLDVEIDRVRKKMEAGASFFLTQPVFTDDAIARVRKIKNETGACILCGIMPFINRKNALFMKNEIAGVEVSDEIIDRYPEQTSREEGEAVGIAIALEIIAKTRDFADGYYFSFPFIRVHMLKQILQKL